tara:strand:- start:466 stop:675 length:210 start_codon:yes stop_codon:yes gene_type:complete
MSRIDTLAEIIKAIERVSKNHAQGSLRSPKVEGDVAFHYGRACGFAQGLDEALRLIELQLKHEEEDHGD